jgi:glyoxylase-like metal-dependent hydrolase (beta-lactamase superfamily II)
MISRHVTRRRFLTSTTAAVAGTFAPAAWAQVPSAHNIKVGSFDVTIVSDGTMQLPLSFALPGAAPADVEALYTANGATFDGLNGQINVTVVRTGSAVIVIDAGGGTDFMPTMGQFGDNLERAGIAAESVTHVVFTHAHADHLWGILDPLDGGTRFPKAKHIITATEFDTWTKPGMETTLPEALRGVALGSARRLKELAARLTQVKADAEIVPGVTLLATPGHTPGHASVLLSSGGQQLLVGGDVLTNPIVSFAKPDWPWGPDADQTQAAATRKRTLDMLATDKIQLLGYHLPWPGVGRVERKDTGFRYVSG